MTYRERRQSKIEREQAIREAIERARHTTNNQDVDSNDRIDVYCENLLKELGIESDDQQGRVEAA